MPRPTDIPFDHAAAAVAVAALERAAAVLADVAEGRSAAGAAAREHFSGSYAGDFDRTDRDLGAASNEARSAVASLRSAITAGADEASRAQAARAAAQQAWDAAPPPPPGVR